MKKLFAICLLAIGSLTALSVNAINNSPEPTQNNVAQTEEPAPCNPCDTTCTPVPCNPAPCNPAPCNPGC